MKHQPERQPDDPARQAANSRKQTEQREEYRREITTDPDRNTGLPGFDNPADQDTNGD